MRLLRSLAVLALASVSSVASTPASSFADSVVSYTPGSGAASGYTNPFVALGEPSRVTPGTHSGPVDPLSPPYLSSQLVSVGAGGSLIVEFNSPILNRANDPFGLPWCARAVDYAA